MSNQEKFIKNIRAALGHPPDIRRDAPELFPQQPSAPSAEIIARIRQRTSDERRELLARMTEAGKPINLRVTAVADEAAATAAMMDLVRQRSPEWENQNQVCAWQHPLLEALDLKTAFKAAGIPLYTVDTAHTEDRATARKEIRRNIIAAYIGITSADFALADTATLVMRTRPGQPRSMAIVPSIHLAVIRLNQMLADLQELYALLRWDEKQWESGLSNYMSFISGPSKTADIEATMVHGAHGPREVHIIVIAGDSD
jgi:L-lactate dehydrogenase complex protein LldG